MAISLGEDVGYLEDEKVVEDKEYKQKNIGPIIAKKAMKNLKKPAPFNMDGNIPKYSMSEAIADDELGYMESVADPITKDWYNTNVNPYQHKLNQANYKQGLLMNQFGLLQDKVNMLQEQDFVYKSSGKPKYKEAVKTKALRAGKNAVKKALVRKVSRKLVTATHQTIITLLQANPSLVLLAQYLNSDVGRAAISGILAVGLEFAPLPEGMKENFDVVKDSLVEELSVMAVDEATMPLENIAGLLLPVMQQALMPLLTSPEVMQLADKKIPKKISAKVIAT